MASNIHLTNDNGVAAFSAAKNHLGGVSTPQYGDHLVVVSQKTDWNNKEFVVTPDVSDCCFCVGYSGGKEQYPNVQGGPNVYRDTNTLVSNVKYLLDHGIWWVMDQNNGTIPLFSCTCRGDGALYNYDSSSWDFYGSEYGVSQMVYSFNLHRLPLSKMASFDAYLRCWAASYIFCRAEMPYGNEGLLVRGGTYNNTSKLRMKLYTSKPSSPAWDLAEDGDSWEMYGVANDGRTVSRDTPLYDGCAVFDPFHHGNLLSNPHRNRLRVYAPPNASSGYSNPETYYTDLKITNSDNLNVMRQNPATLYAVANFHIGNAFSDGNSGHNGIIQGGAVTCFIERVELVLKCTGNKYNV